MQSFLYDGDCLMHGKKNPPLLDDANQIFYSVTKNANFMLLETLRRALTEPNILWLPTPSENRFHSNQICFYSNLGEVFPSPEFQAKLFLMRNWVGGFYRDRLLSINSIDG